LHWCIEHGVAQFGTLGLQQSPMIPNLYLFISGLIILLVIFVILVNWLWNSTLPRLFDFKEISIWETIKILLLAGILFGGARLPFAYNITENFSNTGHGMQGLSKTISWTWGSQK
jgi:hypothetical protein